MRWPLTSALVVAWALAPAPLRAQRECTVAGTFLGRWDQVDVRCDASTSAEPRAADVRDESLRACPLLAGDVVRVEYENDDPARRPTIVAVVTRGNGGAASGDWCARPNPPSPLTGPCSLVEDPPPELQEEAAGARSERRAVHTLFRDVDDGRASVAPGGCASVDLKPGVYRVYVTEEVSRSTWVVCANDPKRLCRETEYETNRYEGGVSLDARAERVASTTDVSPYVRGWSGAGTSASPPPEAIPVPWVIVEPVTMSGVGAGVPWVTLEPLAMSGVGVGIPWVILEPITMSGAVGSAPGGRRP